MEKRTRELIARNAIGIFLSDKTIALQLESKNGWKYFYIYLSKDFPKQQYSKLNETPSDIRDAILNVTQLTKFKSIAELEHLMTTTIVNENCVLETILILRLMNDQI
ncbi:MAG: hypothetical protein A2033_18850 [Bacteroidetes bacterium GWA2_31_9]|nr:MAG: hypothetical protein A2033_18850 [Bacteroidetes bacterium GWA2_31_9]